MIKQMIDTQQGFAGDSQQWLGQHQGGQHVCPNCGYCPCCGRGYRTNPFQQPWPGYPNPYVGDWPMWPTTTVTCGSLGTAVYGTATMGGGLA